MSFKGLLKSTSPPLIADDGDEALNKQPREIT